MNDDYLVSRQFIMGLEHVKSEMELNVTEVKRKNPSFDDTEEKKKIKHLEDTQNYLYVLYEELNRINKLNYELTKQKNSLLADNMILTKSNKS